MKHIAVGEGAPFSYAATARAESLAREDAARSEWLAQRCREAIRQEGDDPGECERCLTALPENCRSRFCESCRRDNARAINRGVTSRWRSRLSADTVACPSCGEAMPRRRRNGEFRKMCQACWGRSAHGQSEAA